LGNTVELLFKDSKGNLTDHTWTFTNAPPNTAVCAPSGLVSWWPGELNCDDVVGTNNGMAQNGVTFVAGKVGCAFDFDGVAARIDFGNQMGNFGTNDFSFDCWVKTSFDGYAFVFGKRNTPGGGSFWDLVVGYGYIYAELDQDGSGDNYVALCAGSIPINDGLFHHVAVSRQGNQSALYVDGLLADSGITSGITMISNDGECFAGAEGVPGDQTVVENPFPGALDDIRIYNRALTASEIAAIYAAGTNGMCAPAPLQFAGSPIYGQGNRIILNATLRSGQSYTFEASTNLATTNWVVLTNFIAGTAPITRFTNTITTNISQQFYRITSP
jgi:hypothetical protein